MAVVKLDAQLENMNEVIRSHLTEQVKDHVKDFAFHPSKPLLAYVTMDHLYTLTLPENGKKPEAPVLPKLYATDKLNKSSLKFIRWIAKDKVLVGRELFITATQDKISYLEIHQQKIDLWSEIHDTYFSNLKGMMLLEISPSE